MLQLGGELASPWCLFILLGTVPSAPLWVCVCLWEEEGVSFFSQMR